MTNLPRRAPRHPSALAVLRAVRDGQPLDGIEDAAGAVASLTHGVNALLAEGDGRYRLTIRGRELLAMAGVPIVRHYRRVRVRTVSTPTRALLQILEDGPAAWSFLQHYTTRGVLAQAAQRGLVERVADGLWALTERGREAARTGCVTTIEREARVVWRGVA